MIRKVIIDTDPGLDDAVAILFALACGHFEVLGLTTVAGNIGLDRTTTNAGGLLSVMQRSDIPVIAGAEAPLLRDGIDAIVVHGDDGLRGVSLPQPTVPAKTGAAAWLAETLAAHPTGTVDILALGPLTNIARLIEEHPAAAARIGQIIAMGGVVDEPGNMGPNSEFNFANDPEAVAVVLHADIRTTIIPLDVTRRVRASRQYVEALRSTAVGSASADMLTAYMIDGKESRPLHDPCVMLLALAPDLFGVEMLRLSVDLSDSIDAGTLRRSDGGNPVKVAMTVDAKKALALLAEGLTRRD
jgi:purine nucleosidase